MGVVILVLGLAGLLGFTAHGAGICAVKAVGEVLTSGGARMLVSFAKTVLWVMALTLPVMLLVPGAMAPVLRWPDLASVAGAFAFGVGAALNGGCAVSTVTRLGNGEVGMLVTILGGTATSALLTAGWSGGPGLPGLPVPGGPAAVLPPGGWWLWGLAVGLAGWAWWELAGMWRGRDRACGLLEGMLHRRWRLSVAAAVIGTCNTAIVLAAGHWAYTGTLRQTVEWLGAGGMAPSALAVALFAALLAGVLASALTRRSFVWRWRPTSAWLGHLAGGALMGVGIATVPGGNDGLLLDALPSLSPHAVPAFTALLAGIAAVLVIRRRLGLPVPRIDCQGDVCHES